MTHSPPPEEQSPQNLLNTSRAQAALIVGGLVMASVILAPLISGTLREALIIPILYILWTIWLFVSRLPQAIFWAIFLGAGLTLALRSLRTGALFRRVLKSPAIRSPGRVTVLSNRIKELNQGIYFRRRMGQHVLRLTLEANGYPQRPPAEELAKMLTDNILNAPDDTVEYLRDSARPASLQGAETMARQRGGIIGWISELLHTKSGAAEDTQAIEVLVTHLEDELEIPHDIIHR